MTLAPLETAQKLAPLIRSSAPETDALRELPRRLERRTGHWIGECGVAVRRVTLICSRSIMVGTRGEISFFQ